MQLRGGPNKLTKYQIDISGFLFQDLPCCMKTYKNKIVILPEFEFCIPLMALESNAHIWNLVFLGLLITNWIGLSSSSGVLQKHAKIQGKMASEKIARFGNIPSR